MSRVTVEQIRSTSELARVMELWDFCRSIPEYETNGFVWPKTLMDARYINELKDALDALEHQEGYDLGALKEGRVPQEIWWARDENHKLIGMAKLRFVLTPGLLRLGGHIGLGLIAEARHKGYGTELLPMLLEKCREHGLRDMLLTANSANKASRGLIEKCGGGLFDIVDLGDRREARYWITLE